MPLYDQIGYNYDITRCADPFIVRCLKNHLNFKSGHKYIDIACGSGNYTIALQEKGANMTGIDESGLMIVTAQRKNKKINWIVGSAEKLPFKNNEFNGAICTLALHHFKSRDSIFGEVYRVIDKGRFVIFTAAPEQMKSYWLNEYFPGIMSASIKQMPSLKSIEKDLKKAGFNFINTESYFVKDDLKDLFLYSGKNHPEKYLNPEVRMGISSFTNLADYDEVEEGCRKLSLDIESGRIKDVMGSFKNDKGDYLFITAEK
ncbi:MAG: class I SAM-dependent methyltransferase [Spirochaetes bacterium]|nr:class I SAM-dependent methyltransferase [Spirochaetota bacterium]